ncbi:hypothetical protein Emag_003612 [Eimeria magna]
MLTLRKAFSGPKALPSTIFKYIRFEGLVKLRGVLGALVGRSVEGKGGPHDAAYIRPCRAGKCLTERQQQQQQQQQQQLLLLLLLFAWLLLLVPFAFFADVFLAFTQASNPSAALVVLPMLLLLLLLLPLLLLLLLLLLLVLLLLLLLFEWRPPAFGSVEVCHLGLVCFDSGNVVLCEHAESEGNFPTVTRLLLCRLPTNRKRMSYIYDRV